MPRKTKEWERYQIDMFDMDGNPIDSDGNIIPEREPIVPQTFQEPKTKILSNTTNNALNETLTENRIPPQSATSEVTSRTKKLVSRRMPTNAPKEVLMSRKRFEYILLPINDQDLSAMTFTLKLREEGKPRYEQFQITLEPIDFQLVTDRTDGRKYYVGPRYISFKNIIKNGGTGRKVYSARGEYYDERNDITSFNYFRYLFDIGGDYDMNAIISREIRDFVDYEYRPSIDD